MRRSTSIALFALAAAVLPGMAASVAAAAPHVDGHFTIPEINTNNKIVEGPDHNMWVTVNDGGGADVSRITPSGDVMNFELDGVSGASGIAPGPEGRLWVTDNTGVESFPPADPTKENEGAEITGVSGGPIVAGPDGQMWVGAQKAVFHFLPSDPKDAKSFEVEGLSPKDIDVVGAELVIADAGLPRIVTMTTAGKVTHEFPIGHPNNENNLEGASQGVAASPTGVIGFSQQAKEPEQVGVIQPGGSTLTVETPPGADPFGIAYGSDTAFWGARKGGAERMTQNGESSFIGGIPDEFFVRQVASGPGDTIWLTTEVPEAGIEKYEVFRISGLEPPAVKPPAATAPETTLDKGPKKVVRTTRKTAKVSFRFSSATAGATFECALTKLTKVKKGKKAKAAKFAACKSPKKYTLKPGRYRFSVRAVSGATVDASPATTTFKVVRIKRHKAPKTH